jgi:hypothetical protein
MFAASSPCRSRTTYRGRDVTEARGIAQRITFAVDHPAAVQDRACGKCLRCKNRHQDHGALARLSMLKPGRGQAPISTSRRGIRLDQPPANEDGGLGPDLYKWRPSDPTSPHWNFEEIAKKSGMKLDQPAPIATVNELANYDAIIFGTPTRFGNMCAQAVVGLMILAPVGASCWFRQRSEDWEVQQRP